MKKFKITNKKSGMKFEVRADNLILQPEYGKPERWAVEADCSEEDKASALETHTDQWGTVRYKLPVQYEVVEEDMTAELAEQESDKLDHEDAKNYLRGLKKADLTTVAKCADAIMRIVKHLRVDK